MERRTEYKTLFQALIDAKVLEDPAERVDVEAVCRLSCSAMNKLMERPKSGELTYKRKHEFVKKYIRLKEATYAQRSVLPEIFGGETDLADVSPLHQYQRLIRYAGQLERVGVLKRTDLSCLGNSYKYLKSRKQNEPC